MTIDLTDPSFPPDDQDTGADSPDRPATGEPDGTSPPRTFPLEARSRFRARRAQPTGTLGRERLREILTRLATGYYDRPEVTQVVAERIYAEWCAE
jgi:hypothetical protein